MHREIREFALADYDSALALWKRCEGMGLSAADERCAIECFLRQNQGLCFVALEDGSLVGTVLGGSDGRRGSLYHLAVDPDWRRQGLGSLLVEHCLEGMKQRGIQKCHLMVMGTNEKGQAFWKHEGWQRREDIVLMSKDIVCTQEAGPC